MSGLVADTQSRAHVTGLNPVIPSEESFTAQARGDWMADPEVGHGVCMIQFIPNLLYRRDVTRQ